MKNGQNENATIPGKLKMKLQDQPELTPEQELIQITRWVTEDIDRMSATLWMIRQEPELLEAIAKKFQEKMDKEKPVNQITRALAEQIQQEKKD